MTGITLHKEEDFVRDPVNKGALLNTNNAALEKYRAQKARYDKLNKVESIEQRLDRLEQLLIKLVESK